LHAPKSIRLLMIGVCRGGRFVVIVIALLPFLAAFPAAPPSPSSFDFSGFPIGGTTSVPLNAVLLVPVPLTGPINAPSASDHRFTLVDEQDVQVATALEVQLVTHRCFDMEVVRLIPRLPLLPQTNYRIVIAEVTDGADVFPIEASSFQTGDSYDFEPPPPPSTRPNESVTSGCGLDLPVSHTGQTLVASISGTLWRGLASGTALSVEGPDALSLVAIDMAGNLSAPLVVEVPELQTAGRGCQGCRQGDQASPSTVIATIAVLLGIRRRNLS
jgi:hypothetical protein